MSLISDIKGWIFRVPQDEVGTTEKIDRSIEELKVLNERSAKLINDLQQPDILRSLVISMNQGRNQ